jgi:hypothetical protein
MLEWKVEIRKRLAGLNLKPEREAEILDELSGHLQDRYDELRAQGALHDEAFRDVIGELDCTDLVSELGLSAEIPHHHALPEGAPASRQLISDFLMDLRYAGRTLRKSPSNLKLRVMLLVAMSCAKRPSDGHCGIRAPHRMFQRRQSTSRSRRCPPPRNSRSHRAQYRE